MSNCLVPDEVCDSVVEDEIQRLGSVFVCGFTEPACDRIEQTFGHIAAKSSEGSDLSWHLRSCSCIRFHQALRTTWLFRLLDASCSRGFQGFRCC